MRRIPRTVTHRSLAAACALSACAAFLGAAPADADSEVPADPGNTVVVTRLSIDHGKGWLTLHTRNASAEWFQVLLPAGDGTWSGPADVYVPEENVHCSRLSGVDLEYQCFTYSYSGGLPIGNYAIRIPVTRTGGVEGLTGSAWAGKERASTNYSYDTFPVLDASHYRSTAEVRAPLVTPDAAGTGWRATVSVTTTIVPGEAITALDVTLPAGGWRITGSNAQHHGARCSTLGSGTATPSLHCRPDAASGGHFTAGRFNLVLDVATDIDPLPSTEVSLTAAGLSAETEDTFPWVGP